MKKTPHIVTGIVYPLVLLLLLSSCASRREIAHPPEIPSPAPPVAILRPAPIPEPEFRSLLLCDETTKEFFNSSGIDVLPFIRVIFYDLDGDGLDEMIAGSKDGSLRLYRNSGTRNVPQWRLEPDYFQGVRAGAFSAPAAGDIDGDGKTEILLGTGGFSADSGKVLFFKNHGTSARPAWEKMDLPEVSVGNDATPALFDADGDGHADLIVGNSSGELFLFRAVRTGNKVTFVKDTAYFRGLKLGMYAAPAVTSYNRKPLIIAGNSMGKLVLLERGKDGGSPWQRTTLNIPSGSFASPVFVSSYQPGMKDLVLSDGSGQLSYFRNRQGNYRHWELDVDFFGGRILAGTASAPVISDLNGRRFMVVGNINGEVRLYLDEPSKAGLLWREAPDFFSGIKLSSFSRGILTEWEGRYLLLTGQQDGMLRAFMNSGTPEKPKWSEKKQFFRGVPPIMHAAPAVFDLDGDGKWELIVGDSNGLVYGFRQEIGKDGSLLWKSMDKDFLVVKVDRFASPSLARRGDKTYLFVGQQDGRIRIFEADTLRSGNSVFRPDGYLEGVQVRNHSAPAAIEKTGLLEISVGDYDGNLRCFLCRLETKEIIRN